MNDAGSSETDKDDRLIDYMEVHVSQWILDLCEKSLSPEEIKKRRSEISYTQCCEMIAICYDFYSYKQKAIPDSLYKTFVLDLPIACLDSVEHWIA